MIIIPIILLIPIAFFLGYSLANYKWTSLMGKGTGRMGIIHRTGGLRSHIIEIEELQVAGDLTKVRVENVIKEKGEYKSTEELLKGFGEWVKTSEIVWYDDNTQRLRNKKLDKLLGR